MTSPSINEVAPRPTRAYDLNIAYFEKVAHANGWMNSNGYNHDLIGKHLGLTGEQVRRVLKRKTRPGVAFMAGLQAAVEDYRVRLMFPLVKANDPIGKD